MNALSDWSSLPGLDTKSHPAPIRSPVLPLSDGAVIATKKAAGRRSPGGKYS
jgi:hypothetical protein